MANGVVIRRDSVLGANAWHFESQNYYPTGQARMHRLDQDLNDEDLSDVSNFLDYAPTDVILRSTKSPAGFRRR